MYRMVRIEGDIAYVPLTKGHEAIIDAADVPLVEGKAWQAQIAKRGVYANHVFNEGGKLKRLAMHRLILAAPPGIFVDHRDCNPLNNRRSNLRFATVQQNAMNQQTPSSSTTGRKGVCWNKRLGKWQAQIRVSGRLKHLGLFTNAEDAAEAYDTAALKHFGGFARPNAMESANV